MPASLEAREQAQRHFLSRPPETYGVAVRVKAAARAGPWQDIGAMSTCRSTAHYTASEQRDDIEARLLRIPPET